MATKAPKGATACKATKTTKSAKQKAEIKQENVRKGRQTPTQSIILLYADSHGQEAVDLYNSSGRTAQEWQQLLVFAYNIY